jgi:tetratricopeptide (TPR) repeat protein
VAAASAEPLAHARRGHREVIRVAAALVVCGVLTTGCARQGAGERPDLRPVGEPDVSAMSEAVGAQVRERYAAVSARRDDPSATAADLAAAYGAFGQLLLAARYLDTAEPALLNARTLAPEDPRWAYYLAHVYRQRGALEPAAAAFRQVLDRRPGDLAASIWLASVYIDQGRHDEAQPLLESALRRHPDVEAAHYHLGRLALARRDFAGAARQLEAAQRRNPAAAAIRYPLAMAYRGLGRQADAEAQLRGRDQRNAEVAPPDPLMDDVAALLAGPQAYLVRGTEALTRGEWQTAAGEFRQGLERAPRDPQLRHRLATALSMTGDTGAAERELEEALRVSPGYAPAHYSLGLLLEGRGRDAEAIARYSAALTAQPGYVPARLRIAAVLRRTGRAEEALAHYEEVVRLDPGAADAPLEAAITLVRLGRYAAARDRLTAGMERFPQQGGYARALARLLAAAPDDRVRDGRRALALAERLLKEDQSTEVGETMAMALAEVGEYGEAARGGTKRWGM